MGGGGGYGRVPRRESHPHCYASQCGVGIGGCVWEVNLWLRCPRDVWAMSGHASPPPCCSRKAVLWTLVLESGDVVWTKYKNYRAPACTHQSSTISTSTTTSTSTEGTTGGGTGAQSLRGYGRVSCGRSSEIAHSPRHRCQSPRTREMRRSRKERRRRHHVRGGSDRSLASASVS